MAKIEIKITDEEYYVNKLEECCYILRDAMIDLSLKFPEIITFERYFRELKEYDSIAYIVSLLHKCWCFAHPTYLFDTVPKDISYEGLEKILSKYQPGAKRYGMDVLKEEFDKENSHLLMAYYRAYCKAGEMTLSYGKYMDDLYRPTSKICSAFNISLNRSFIMDSTIKTDKTPKQLKDAFYVFAKDFGCCDPGDENLRIFLSIFDITQSAAEGVIMWTDTGTRSKQASIASIHTIFSTLGVQMNKHTRRVIAQHIVWQNGTITEEQIKARSENQKQKKLREQILKAIAYHTEQ